ncbi:hypothetical protein [Flavobacterium chungangense]|uniref:DUF2860 domain-containing protein n=1 Tax=Flavobacterium chungangense TaxID=554283 RepID=A0A6V6Z665_9FLAO|nr:hypothetical protein [Flavobacterium chungangense]CAD0007135.1 hypothetical protein FLACHUCJ7_03194 [Flavobacterium chungangense]
MKSLYLIFVFSLGLGIQDCSSQNDSIVSKEVVTIEKTQSVKTISKPFWDKISIKKSFDSKTDDDEKAATISLTLPKDNDDIFKVNAGIGYTLGKLNDNKYNAVTGFFVYNKNNQIDKRQENYKLGINHNFVYFTKKDLGIINDNSLEYLNDNVKKAQSIIALSTLSIRSNSGKLIFESYAIRNSAFAYKLLPKIGLEYQSSYDAALPLEQGYYFRSYFNIGGAVLLKKRTVIETVEKTNSISYNSKGIELNREESEEVVLTETFSKKGLELIINYERRNSLLDNFDNNPNYTYLLKGELKLYPINNNNLSIGLSYNKGENPLEGLEKQEFWMLGFNFKK